jgi:hypothetical protein
MNSYKEIITWPLIIIFLCQNIVLAEPFTAPKTTNNISMPSIYIPESYGKIDIQNPKPEIKNSPMVVLVKDAHCVYEAQKNISNILNILISDYKINLVCVEGAVDKVDTSKLGSYQDVNAREKVSEKYLKSGLLSASEALSIKKGSNPGFAIYGVEDAKLYWKDFQAFKDTMGVSDVNERFLNLMYNLVSQLKNKIYSQQLLVFDNEVIKYESGEMALTEWVKYLSNQKLMIENQKNFSLVLKAVGLEEKIDFKKVEIERTDLIKELEKSFVKEDLKELVKKSLLFKLGKMSALDYYIYLEGISQNKAKDNLARYIQLVELQSNINETELFDELSVIKENIFKSLIADEITKKLYEVSEKINILKNILFLKANRKQVAYYNANRNEFGPACLFEFIKIQAPLNNVSIPDEFNDILFLQSVDKSMLPSQEFYKMAFQRDQVLVDNLLKRMTEMKEDKAVLVCGGFHSEGMSKLLEDQNINVVSISPAITKVQEDSQKIYLSRMMDENINPENIISELGLGNLSPNIVEDMALPEKLRSAQLQLPIGDMEKYSRKIGLDKATSIKDLFKDNPGMKVRLEKEFIETDDEGYAEFLLWVLGEYYNAIGSAAKIAELKEKRVGVKETGKGADVIDIKKKFIDEIKTVSKEKRLDPVFVEKIMETMIELFGFSAVRDRFLDNRDECLEILRKIDVFLMFQADDYNSSLETMRRHYIGVLENNKDILKELFDKDVLSKLIKYFGYGLFASVFEQRFRDKDTGRVFNEKKYIKKTMIIDIKTYIANSLVYDGINPDAESEIVVLIENIDRVTPTFKTVGYNITNSLREGIEKDYASIGSFRSLRKALRFNLTNKPLRDSFIEGIRQFLFTSGFRFKHEFLKDLLEAGTITKQERESLSLAGGKGIVPVIKSWFGAFGQTSLYEYLVGPIVEEGLFRWMPFVVLYAVSLFFPMAGIISFVAVSIVSAFVFATLHSKGEDRKTAIRIAIKNQLFLTLLLLKNYFSPINTIALVVSAFIFPVLIHIYENRYGNKSSTIRKWFVTKIIIWLLVFSTPGILPNRKADALTGDKGNFAGEVFKPIENVLKTDATEQKQTDLGFKRTAEGRLPRYNDLEKKFFEWKFKKLKSEIDPKIKGEKKKQAVSKAKGDAERWAKREAEKYRAQNLYNPSSQQIEDVCGKIGGLLYPAMKGRAWDSLNPEQIKILIESLLEAESDDRQWIVREIDGKPEVFVLDSGVGAFGISQITEIAIRELGKTIYDNLRILSKKDIDADSAFRAEETLKVLYALVFADDYSVDNYKKLKLEDVVAFFEALPEEKGKGRKDMSGIVQKAHDSWEYNIRLSASMLFSTFNFLQDKTGEYRDVNSPIWRMVIASYNWSKYGLVEKYEVDKILWILQTSEVSVHTTRFYRAFQDLAGVSLDGMPFWSMHPLVENLVQEVYKETAAGKLKEARWTINYFDGTMKKFDEWIKKQNKKRQILDFEKIKMLLGVRSDKQWNAYVAQGLTVRQVFHKSLEKQTMQIKPEAVQQVQGDVGIVRDAKGFYWSIEGVRKSSVFGVNYQPVPEGKHPNDFNGIKAGQENFYDLYKALLPVSEGGQGHAEQLKAMGVEAIRVYGLGINNEQDIERVKKLFRTISRYGIRVIVTDFAGLYTHPNNWAKNRADFVKLVETYSKEPWVLAFNLGNENNYYRGDHNEFGWGGELIRGDAESYYREMSKIAVAAKRAMGKSVKPIGIGNGNLSDVELDALAKHTDGFDFIGLNSYQNPDGIVETLARMKEKLPNLPVFFTEYGLLEAVQPAHGEYFQKLTGSIQGNTAGAGATNAIGGCLFEATDEAWKASDTGLPWQGKMGVLGKGIRPFRVSGGRKAEGRISRGFQSEIRARKANEKNGKFSAFNLKDELVPNGERVESAILKLFDDAKSKIDKGSPLIGFIEQAKQLFLSSEKIQFRMVALMSRNINVKTKNEEDFYCGGYVYSPARNRHEFQYAEEIMIAAREYDMANGTNVYLEYLFHEALCHILRGVYGETGHSIARNIQRAVFSRNYDRNVSVLGQLIRDTIDSKVLKTELEKIRTLQSSKKYYDALGRAVALYKHIENDKRFAQEKRECSSMIKSIQYSIREFEAGGAGIQGDIMTRKWGSVIDKYYKISVAGAQVKEDFLPKDIPDFEVCCAERITEIDIWGESYPAYAQWVKQFSSLKTTDDCKKIIESYRSLKNSGKVSPDVLSAMDERISIQIKMYIVSAQKAYEAGNYKESMDWIYSVEFFIPVLSLGDKSLAAFDLFLSKYDFNVLRGFTIEDMRDLKAFARKVMRAWIKQGLVKAEELKFGDALAVFMDIESWDQNTTPFLSLISFFETIFARRMKEHLMHLIQGDVFFVYGMPDLTVRANVFSEDFNSVEEILERPVLSKEDMQMLCKIHNVSDLKAILTYLQIWTETWAEIVGILSMQSYAYLFDSQGNVSRDEYEDLIKLIAGLESKFPDGKIYLEKLRHAIESYCSEKMYVKTTVDDIAKYANSGGKSLMPTERECIKASIKDISDINPLLGKFKVNSQAWTEIFMIVIERLQEFQKKLRFREGVIINVKEIAGIEDIVALMPISSEIKRRLRLNLIALRQNIWIKNGFPPEFLVVLADILSRFPGELMRNLELPEPFTNADLRSQRALGLAYQESGMGLEADLEAHKKDRLGEINETKLEDTVWHELIHKASFSTTFDGNPAIPPEIWRKISKDGGFIGYINDSGKFVFIDDDTSNLMQFRSIGYTQWIYQEEDGRFVNYVEREKMLSVGEEILLPYDSLKGRINVRQKDLIEKGGKQYLRIEVREDRGGDSHAKASPLELVAYAGVGYLRDSKGAEKSPLYGSIIKYLAEYLFTFSIEGGAARQYRFKNGKREVVSVSPLKARGAKHVNPAYVAQSIVLGFDAIPKQHGFVPIRFNGKVFTNSIRIRFKEAELLVESQMIPGAFRPIYVLKYYDERGNERTYNLKWGENTVGRDSTNNVVLANAYISRKHLRIIVDEDGIEIIDFGSNKFKVADEGDFPVFHAEGFKLQNAQSGLWVNGVRIDDVKNGVDNRREEIKAQEEHITYDINGKKVHISNEFRDKCVASGFDITWLNMYLQNMFADTETMPRGNEIFIDLLSGSEHLFEDHTQNGYIGINQQLFSVKDKGLIDKLLKVGIRHELKHEAGTEKTEEELLQEDILYAQDLGIGKNEIDLLSVIVQKEGFVEGIKVSAPEVGILERARINAGDALLKLFPGEQSFVGVRFLLPDKSLEGMAEGKRERYVLYRLYGNMKARGYEIQRHLATSYRHTSRGGNVRVYLAKEIATGREVVVKIGEHAQDETKDIFEVIAGQSKPSLKISSHPALALPIPVNLPNTQRLGDKLTFSVAEYAQGQMLSALVDQGAQLNPVLIAKIVLQIAEGIQHLNNAGYVYTDLMSSNYFIRNIVVDKEFNTKIIDFEAPMFCRIREQRNIDYQLRLIQLLLLRLLNPVPFVWEEYTAYETYSPETFAMMLKQRFQNMMSQENVVAFTDAFSASGLSGVIASLGIIEKNSSDVLRAEKLVPKAQKAPGVTWSDEDRELFEEQVERVVSSNSTVISGQEAEKVQEAVIEVNKRAKAGIDISKIQVHIADPEQFPGLGIPKKDGDTYVKDMVYAIGEKGKDGKLHIYVTKQYWEVLSKNILQLAETIDHEWCENMLGNTHREAASRARFFVKEGSELSEYHLFAINQLYNDGLDGILPLLEMLSEKRSVFRKFGIFQGVGIKSYENKFRKYIEKILTDMNGYKGSEESLQDINGVERLVVIGDLHGNYDNLFNILKQGNVLDGLKSGKTHLVLLGDVIDTMKLDELTSIQAQGDSLKALMLVMRLLTLFPQNVHYILGNHEIGYLNSKFMAAKMGDNGKPFNQTEFFEKYMKRYYGKAFLGSIKRFFRTLPYIVRVNNEIILTHPGAPVGVAIPEDTLKKIDINDDAQEDLVANIVFRNGQRAFNANETSVFLFNTRCRMVISGHTPPRSGMAESYGFKVIKEGVIGQATDKQLIVSSYDSVPGYLDIDLAQSQLGEGTGNLLDGNGMSACKVVGKDIVEEVVDEIFAILKGEGIAVRRETVWEAVIGARKETGIPTVEKLVKLMNEAGLDSNNMFSLAKKISVPLQRLSEGEESSEGRVLIANVLMNVLQGMGASIQKSEDVRETFFKTVRKLLTDYGITEAELAGEMELIEQGLFLLEFDPLLNLTKVEEGYFDYFKQVCALAGVAPETLKRIFSDGYAEYQDAEIFTKAGINRNEFNKLGVKAQERVLRKKGLWERYQSTMRIMNLIGEEFKGAEIVKKENSSLNKGARRLKLYQGIIKNGISGNVNVELDVDGDLVGLSDSIDFKDVGVDRPQALVQYLSNTSVAQENGSNLAEIFGLEKDKPSIVSIPEKIFIEKMDGNKLTYSPGLVSVLKQVPGLIVEIRTADKAQTQRIVDVILKEYPEFNGRILVVDEFNDANDIKDAANKVYVLGERQDGIGRSLEARIKDNSVKVFSAENIAFFGVLIYGAKQATIEKMFEDGVYTKDAADLIRKLEVFGVSKALIDDIINNSEAFFVVKISERLNKYRLTRSTIDVSA